MPRGIPSIPTMQGKWLAGGSFLTGGFSQLQRNFLTRFGFLGCMQLMHTGIHLFRLAEVFCWGIISHREILSYKRIFVSHFGLLYILADAKRYFIHSDQGKWLAGGSFPTGEFSQLQGIFSTHLGLLGCILADAQGFSIHSDQGKWLADGSFPTGGFSQLRGTS